VVVPDSEDMRSAARRLWARVTRVVLENGLRSARLAQTVCSLGDQAGARQIAAYARKYQRHVVKFLSAAQLSKQEEQEIRKKLKQIDDTLGLLPPKGRRSRS
jgi:hypothetical protein